MKERILVTGARGVLGSALVPRLSSPVYPADLENADIRNRRQVRDLMAQARPTLIYHLAGAKSAPEGETNPAKALAVNAIGTANILLEAGGARVVTASTCKACDPETAYGASKLIAERLTLQAGGSVARFYNIRESAGNVFDLWSKIPEPQALPVTPCWRYFISLEQALELLLAIRDLPEGRYTVDPGEGKPMEQWAHEAFPGRAQLQIPPRRGDRLIEPRHATNEKLEGDVIQRITNTHDRELIPA